MRLRGGVPVAVVLVVVLLLAACGSDSTSTSRRTRAATTTTTPPRSTTPTTVAPKTVPVPPAPPPGPPTSPPPPITVPRSTPRSTTSPKVTTGSAPTSSRPGPTTSTATTTPSPVVRKTVVYSPPGAPKRKGDLVLPSPQHADTIIVLAHGGAGTAGSQKQMRGWADFYAAQGYPTLAIDYFLYQARTPAPVYARPETDVKAAVQFLRGRAGQLGLDPNRIVVQGFATGAALDAQAEVTPDDPFFSGPGHYPRTSDKPAAFIGFYGRYDGGQIDPMQYYGGPPDSPDPKVKERYAKADSIAHASDAAGPTLLFQGDADTPAFVDSATRLRDALQSAGKDVSLTLVPGAGHAFDQDKAGALTPAGQQAAQQVLAWLAARFPQP